MPAARAALTPFSPSSNTRHWLIDRGGWANFWAQARKTSGSGFVKRNSWASVQMTGSNSLNNSSYSLVFTRYNSWDEPVPIARNITRECHVQRSEVFAVLPIGMSCAAKCRMSRSAPGKSLAAGNASVYKAFDWVRNSSSVNGKSSSPRRSTFVRKGKKNSFHRYWRVSICEISNDDLPIICIFVSVVKSFPYGAHSFCKQSV